MFAGGDKDSYVSVKRDALLTALQDNLEKHEVELKEANAAFRESATNQLQLMLDLAKAGKEIQLSVGFMPPPDNRKAYQRVIRMLDMCTKDEVQISETEFAQYVMDEWGWKTAFRATTMAYAKGG